MMYYLLMSGPVLLETKNKMAAKGPRGFEEHDSNQAVQRNLSQNSATQTFAGISTRRSREDLRLCDGFIRQKKARCY